MKVDIWSDTTCPFCYIGKRRLENVAKKMGEPLEITWHSYELDPDAKATYPEGFVKEFSKRKGVSEKDALERMSQVTEIGKQEGIHFDWPNVKMGNTFNVHRLIQLAQKHGLGSKAEEDFFRAYFTEGKEIGNPDVVRDIAVNQTGLNPAEVDEVLQSDKFAPEVRQDEQIAHQNLKISGVPFFVFNDSLAFSGAQPDEVFEEAINRARGTSMAGNTSKTEKGHENEQKNDECSDGSCKIN